MSFRPQLWLKYHSNPKVPELSSVFCYAPLAKDIAKGADMEVALKRLKPGIMLAVGVALFAGLAIAVARAIDVDLDLRGDPDGEWLGIGA